MAFILLLLISNTLWAQTTPDRYTCGAAIGFQPYQYVKLGKAHGLDIDIFKEVFSGSTNIELKSMPWRDAVSQLEFGLLDCVLGMEITKERLSHFKFGPKLYDRQIRIFVPQNSKFTTLNELQGQIVANDKGSQLFHKLRETGVAQKIRLLDVATKAESFELLKNGKVVAMIGPKRVVNELSRKSGFKVRAIEDIYVDVPVAIAFKKADHPLRELLKNNMLTPQTIKKIKLLTTSP